MVSNEPTMTVQSGPGMPELGRLKSSDQPAR